MRIAAGTPDGVAALSDLRRAVQVRQQLAALGIVGEAAEAIVQQNEVLRFM